MNRPGEMMVVHSGRQTGRSMLAHDFGALEKLVAARNGVRVDAAQTLYAAQAPKHEVPPESRKEKLVAPALEFSEAVAAVAFIRELAGKTTRQLKQIVLDTPNTPELEEGERLLLVMSIKLLQGRMPKTSYNAFLLEVVEAARHK